MTEWKVVPVEPTDEQIDAALEYDIFDQVRGAGRIVALHLYQATLAAAPTPPVVLPPHDDPTSDPWLHEYAERYARAALAQYGIKEQSDE